MSTAVYVSYRFTAAAVRYFRSNFSPIPVLQQGISLKTKRRIFLMKGISNSQPPVSPHHDAILDHQIEIICRQTGDCEQLDLLVKEKENIAELRFVDGWSPLQTAAFNFHFEVVEYFIINKLVPIDLRDQMGCSALHLAALRGADKIAEFILNTNPEYEPLSLKRHNHVHYAILGGHLEVIKLLSKYGRKPFETPCQDGLTPFMLACRIGRSDVVKYLLTTYDFDLERTDHAGCTALHHACCESHIHIVSYLLENGAKMNCLNSLRKSPLDVCKTEEVRESVMSIVLHYEKNTSEPMQFPDRSPPPISQEVIFDDYSAYLLLIKEIQDFVNSISPVCTEIVDVSDINCDTEQHNDFLENSSFENLSPVALPNGIHCKSIDNSNFTSAEPEKSLNVTSEPVPVLEIPGDNGHHVGKFPESNFTTRSVSSNDSSKSGSAQRDLLNRLSNPMPSEGVQSLVWSICKRTGDVLALATLLRSHPEALHENIRDSKGSTPLHCAITAGFTDLVQFLLQRHVYLSVPDMLGNTPLHLACFFGNSKIVNLFLQSDQVLCRAVNIEGKTPLHIASHQGYLEVVRLLVENGAAPIDATDLEGHTAADLAEVWQHDDILKYFSKLNDPHPDVEITSPDNTLDNLVVYQDGDCYLGLADQPQYVELMEAETDSVSDPSENCSSPVEISFEPASISETNHSSTPIESRDNLHQESPTIPELRQPLIEICNGVIFEETFDDLESNDGEVDRSASMYYATFTQTEDQIMIENSTQYDPHFLQCIVSTQTEAPSLSDNSMQCDIQMSPLQTSSTQTEERSVNHVGIQCVSNLSLLSTSKSLPFLLKTTRLLSIRQGLLLGKYFYKWNAYRPPKKVYNVVETLRMLTFLSNKFHEVFYRSTLQKAFDCWKLIPKRKINHHQRMVQNKVPFSVTTPNAQSHRVTHEVDSTPLLEGMTPNIPAILLGTPQSDSKIVQKLRFSDIVDVSIMDPLQDKEEDLTILGPLPVETLPLFKSNEAVLWEMLTFYVANKLSIPSHKTEEKKRITKRIISPASLWNLFSDFAVCPTVCSKASLKNIIDSLLSPHQLPTVFLSPKTTRPNIKPTDAVVSFLGFQKILWAIARDCLDAPSGKDPVSRLLSLFSRLESSPGRKKMASHPRNAQVLPPFVLGDQMVKRSASKSKADSSTKKSNSPATARNSSEFKSSTPLKSTPPIHSSSTTPSTPSGGIEVQQHIRESQTKLVSSQILHDFSLTSSPLNITADAHVEDQDILNISTEADRITHTDSLPTTKEQTDLMPREIVSNKLTSSSLQSEPENRSLESAVEPILTLPPRDAPSPKAAKNIQIADASSDMKLDPKPQTIISPPKVDVPNQSVNVKIEPTIPQSKPPSIQVATEGSPKQEIQQSKKIADLPKLDTSHPQPSSYFGRPPLSPWSSSRQLGGQFSDDLPPASSNPDETLEELTKAPVADRVNAKLAAKQFEALVNKLKTEPTRGVSPVRERPLHTAPQTSETDQDESLPKVRRSSMPPLHTSEADQDTLGSLPKVRRPSMPHPLRRNQSERTYTQSIWLNDNPEEAKKPDKPPEPPPKKPPAPLLKRASEKSGIGTLTISTDIVENSFAEKDHEGNNPTEQPRSTTPSRREMWGNTFKDEGKIQGALSLWRKSARDFHRHDEEEEEQEIVEHAGSTDPGHDSGTDGGINDVEIPSDSDFPITPNSRNRKHRGFTTRRR